jgi:hypothetical protein
MNRHLHSVGETPFTHDPKVLIDFVRSNELRMTFNFELHDVDADPSSVLEPKKIQLTDLKKIHKKWQVAMYEGNGWNRWVSPYLYAQTIVYNLNQSILLIIVSTSETTTRPG